MMIKNYRQSYAKSAARPSSIRASLKSTQLNTMKPTSQAIPRNNVPSSAHLTPLIPLTIVNPRRQRSNHSQHKKAQTQSKVIPTPCSSKTIEQPVKKRTTSGINERFLYMRKENHLNTCFNIRKNKLKEITKINKQIYQRLNSQKSLYSNHDLSKSYQSIKVIKDRLSNSKISQRSSLSRQSSRSSLKDSRGAGPLKKKKENNVIQIKAQTIEQIQGKELDKYRILFQGAKSKVRQTIDEPIAEKGKNGVYMRSIKPTGRMSIHSSRENKAKNDQKEDLCMAGGLLHRIVEDYLTENKENTGKKRRN